MWELAKFKEHVLDKFGSLDVWEKKILPKMKNISRCARPSENIYSAFFTYHASKNKEYQQLCPFHVLSEQTP